MTVKGTVTWLQLESPEQPTGVATWAQLEAPEQPKGIVTWAKLSSPEQPVGIVTWLQARVRSQETVGSLDIANTLDIDQ